MNRSKTKLYTVGMNQNESNGLASLGFTLGSLLIRYLGLSLMHRKLRLTDYRPLLDKLKGCFTAWTTKALSFAGRKQLLSSVIYGSINFWTSAFLLPKGCLKQIQSLCKKFLWSGKITGNANVKIAWTTVCQPKREGGLGLRDFGLWNKTLCLKLIWRLFDNADSLWAEWIKENRMGSRNFWEIDETKATSWTWRSLLQLRPLAALFLHAELGSGSSISFWWDHWTPLWPLIKRFGPGGPLELSVLINAAVSDVLVEDGWRLRGARSPAAEELQIHLTTVTLPTPSQAAGVADSFYWEIEGSKTRGFSTKATWEVLRPREEVKEWVSSVWFRGAVPRQAFTHWVAQYDRLPTRERLVSWGLQVPLCCCLCNYFVENRDHIFRRCKWMEELWSLVLRRLGIRQLAFHTWTAFSEWLNIRYSHSSRLLKRLASQATVYNIWIKRNIRLHNDRNNSPGEVFKIIDRQV